MADDPRSAGGTTEAIMWATFRALGEHGYPGTSISRIADEFDKSRSLLYYHYEDKNDLLADFLGHLLDEFEAELGAAECDDPYDRLREVVDVLVPAGMGPDERRFRRALLEMRSQAPHEPSFHEQFERTDDLIVSELADAIERGAASGRFEDVDPERTAEFLYAQVLGVLLRALTLGDDERLERNREALIDGLESSLLADRD